MAATNYKAAFFDIDGTLVGFNTHRIPESARRAIAQLRRNGIKCFIASGRHISNIDNLDNIEFDGYVTVNGGMTYIDGKIIDTNPINNADVKEMLDIIYSQNKLAVSMVLDEGLVINIENERSKAIFEQLAFKKKPIPTDLHRYAETNVYQMISFFTISEEPEIMRRLPHCQSERWSPIFTDVVPKGQNKVRGIQAICSRHGISKSEIMAFGDGGNDIAMLTYAGLGVAMGNASDEVKRNADLVCPDVDSDGIAWAVATLGLPIG